MYSAILAFLSPHLLPIALSLLAIYLLRQRYTNGLRHYPGPFIASFTPAWQVYDVWRSVHRVPFLALHKRYGAVVRLGPNKLSFSSPDAIKDIYVLPQKSDMHLVAQHTSNGRAYPSLFGNTNAQWHNNLRRQVNSAFSMTTIVQYEELSSEAVDAVLNQLSLRFVRENLEFDLATWLRYYAEDSVTNATYGKRMRLLETEDSLGLIATTTRFLNYAGPVMPYPFLDQLLWKNPVLLFLNRHGFLNKPAAEIVPFALKAQQDRKELRRQSSLQGQELLEQNLTDKFLAAQAANTSQLGPDELLSLGISIIVAGSETTAATLSALFGHLLNNPSCYDTLKVEVDTAFPRGTTITFSEARNLPYLSAVIKEAFRMHPAARFEPERVVPPEGKYIGGEWIPGGTVVGVSAWVVHRDTSIFGDDPESFKPERWYQNAARKADFYSDEADGEEEAKKVQEGEELEEEARLKRMDSHLLHFGTGFYTCIGKNIAIMEMYKVVPALIREFDFERRWTETEGWRLEARGFVNVKGLKVRIRKRDQREPEVRGTD